MINVMINNLKYSAFLSNEITNNQIYDYIKVHNIVFASNFNESIFERKYIKNIYGQSIIIVVYDKDEPVAIRSFWRNDIDNYPSFQPCDTAVLEDYRGKNIFQVMTKISLEFIGNNYIYNFPNSNSKKLYLRNGWKLIKEYYLRLLIHSSIYCKEHPDQIPDEYVNWWYKDRNDVNLYFYKKGKIYFLLRKKHYNIYIIIGRISKNVSNYFCIAKFPIIFYRTKKKPILIKTSKICVISKNNSKEEPIIPLFKIDVF